MKKSATKTKNTKTKFSSWYLVVLGFVLVVFGGMYLKLYKSTEVMMKPDVATPVQEYVSTDSGIRMKFAQPFFVTETQTLEDGITRGDVVISTSPGGDVEKTHLTIVYGIPYIDGKGGACGGENGAYWKKMRILDELIDVCDVNLVFHAGYPKNKTKDVEYSFFIGGDDITKEEFESYKQILSDGLFYINK